MMFVDVHVSVLVESGCFVLWCKAGDSKQRQGYRAP